MGILKRTTVCVECGKSFHPHSIPRTRKPSVFCSVACKGAGAWRSRKPPDERFWSKVDKSGPNGCWVWTASVFKSGGYGAFGYTSTDIRRAHRYAWEITRGPIPEGAFLLHSCDNPLCVNPSHLRPGTTADNSQDAVDRNRTTLGRWKVLPPERVSEIRSDTRTIREIAADYGVSNGYVSRLKRNLARRGD